MKEKEIKKRVENGSYFKINFKNRSLKLGRKEIEVEFESKLSEDFESELYKLFEDYKFSVPSEIASYRKSYFKCLPYEELDTEFLIYGKNRELARFELDFFLLKEISLGRTWEDIRKLNKRVGWFYQNEKDSDLILLKSWFLGEKK